MIDFDGVDLNEMEKQRYASIKRKGEYMELNILIGTEKENYEDKLGRMPVITTSMYHCGPEEIACMYATLKSLVEHFQEHYPIECLLSDAFINIDNLGSIDIRSNPEEDE